MKLRPGERKGLGFRVWGHETETWGEEGFRV